MYIYPNSTLKLYNNVSLNNKYAHTLYFGSAKAQSDFFHKSLTPKYQYNNLTYQRINRGVIRVKQSADDIYDCNYMAFQNTSYGQKWFYAFIKQVEYVNDNTAEIIYEIDVMQTYFIQDCQIKSCFVEREHISSDDLFANLIPEPLTGLEMIVNDTESYELVSDYICGLFSVFHDTSNPPLNPPVVKWDSSMVAVDGVFNYPISDAHRLDSFLQEHFTTDYAKNVVSCFTYPEECVQDKTQKTFNYPGKMTNAWSVEANLEKLDGYEPKNKKLFTSQFNYLLVSNQDGQTIDLKYENFEKIVILSGNVTFFLNGTIIPEPQVWCHPYRYEGVENNYELGVGVTKFPSVLLSSDSYKSWMYEHQPSLILSGLGSILKGVTGITSGSVKSASSGFGSLFGLIGQSMDAERKPNTAIGQLNYNGLKTSINEWSGFKAYKMCLRKDMAIMVDDFFSKYGYQTNEVKIPNISSRPHWNYIKTNDAFVTGKCPSDDLKKICDIFDNGITFWKNLFEIGDYSLNNQA